MRSSFLLKLALTLPFVAGCDLFVGCTTAHMHAASQQTDVGPAASVQILLKARGLPEDFFQPGAETKCSNQIFGYRFVVWLDSENVAVGFNTSPCFRRSPDRKVDGVLRVLVLDLKGKLKASRDLPYLADGNGEVVADGEATAGPVNTLLVRIQSVNLDSDGRQESKSGVRLLDASLKDVAQRDLFLEQTTFVEHDVVTESGSPFGGGHTVSILGGSGLKEIASRQVDWPAGAMDRKFGEHGFAFMSCGQELHPGEYTNTSVVHADAKFRCTLNALGENVAARGVAQACVSNSGRRIVDANINALGIGEIIAFSLSLGDVSAGKPDPEPYREAARRLGAEPQATVAVEDSGAGARSARAAGLYVVGYAPEGNAFVGADRSVAKIIGRFGPVRGLIAPPPHLAFSAAITASAFVTTATFCIAKSIEALVPLGVHRRAAILGHDHEIALVGAGARGVLDRHVGPGARVDDHVAA